MRVHVRRPVIMHLITPHGDRELSDSPYPGEVVKVLITPHGDRERCSSRRVIRAMSSSLPLMGIGNDNPDPFDTGQTAAHYPSWGSGTTSLAGLPIITLISLPLMGIGNPLFQESRGQQMGSPWEV